MSVARDDFRVSVRNELARRAGYLCSNPGCRILTVGPSLVDDEKSVVIGEAAHIKAASPNGPRYDPKMTSEERADISNGIWLCSNCHRVIDRDVAGYSVELLYDWKDKAEQEAGMQIHCVAEGPELLHLSSVSLGRLGDLLAEVITVQKTILKLQRAVRYQIINVKAAPGAIAKEHAELGFVVLDERLRDAIEDYALDVGDLALYREYIGVDPLTSSRFIDYHDGIRSVIRKDRKMCMSFLDLEARLAVNKPQQPIAAEAVTSILSTMKRFDKPHQKIMDLDRSVKVIPFDY